jgi:hypothetical protein
MSTFSKEIQVCQHCGVENEVLRVDSTNQLESPDLDLRPGKMMRWNINLWIHECSNCGYVSRNLSEKPLTKYNPSLYTFIESLGFHENARKFYKKYLIEKENGNFIESFENGLRAAWICDDNKDTENARKIRKEILKIAEKVIEQGTDMDAVLLRTSDVARRAEEFEKALFYLEQMKDDPTRIMLEATQFQRKLIKEKDIACYKISDAKPKEE